MERVREKASRKEKLYHMPSLPWSVLPELSPSEEDMADALYNMSGGPHVTVSGYA
jgi:hypothetical protein